MSRHITSILSALFGKFASYNFPTFIQNIINAAYVKFLKLDMSRFKHYSSYKSLKELFIRSLQKTPVIDAKIDSIIAPCDAKIVDIGKIKQNIAYQIKGMSYSVNELIKANLNSTFLEDGDYINFYLSPKDYHRYHAPFDIKILSIQHIPGKLYPVNIPFLKKKRNLYIENERVVLEVLDRFNKKHFIILVGALNVGKMVVTFEDRVKTNLNSKYLHIKYENPITIKKGELFGWFEMGSTIVILSQKNALNWSVNLNDKVTFGDVIGELNNEN